MAEKEAPIYVGNGKRREFTTDDGSTIITVGLSLCLSDIPKEFIQKSDKNGKSYVNLDLNKRREVSEYGHTHSLKVNTWKPDKEKAAPKKDDEDW